MVRKHVDFEVTDFRELSGGIHDWTSYSQRVLALGPLAYWRSLTSGDTFADVSGNNHHGTVVSGAAADAPGALARDADPAILLDHARVEVPHHPTLSGFEDFTIVFWLSIDHLPTSGAEYVVAVNQQSGVSEGAWFIAFRGTAQLLWLSLYSDGSTRQDSVGIPYGLLSLEHWHCCGFRRQDGVVTAWLDGAVVDSATYSPALHQSMAMLTLGERGDPGINQWSGGGLDELAIFNLALADRTMTDLFDLGLGRFTLMTG